MAKTFNDLINENHFLSYKENGIKGEIQVKIHQEEGKIKETIVIKPCVLRKLASYWTPIYGPFTTEKKIPKKGIEWDSWLEIL